MLARPDEQRCDERGQQRQAVEGEYLIGFVGRNEIPHDRIEESAEDERRA